MVGSLQLACTFATGGTQARCCTLVLSLRGCTLQALQQLQTWHCTSAAEDQKGLHLVLFDLGGGAHRLPPALAACWQSWLLKLTGDGMGEVTSWSMPLPSLSDFFHCILCLCRPFCGATE